jgi:DNA N-6-adenine-methyltransferase Dam
MVPGFKPTNHPNMVKKRGVDDAVDDRQTPPCVFVPLDAEFAFTLDAAASHENHKCARYCTLAGGQLGNGLAISWAGERVWINPPFSRIRPWVEKAWDERASELVALLLPNNRGEQPFFQDLIEPYRDRPGSILTTRNLRKRRPFLSAGQEIGNRTSKSPPFGLTLVLWDRRRPALGAR